MNLARRTFLGFLGGLAAAPVMRAFVPTVPVPAPPIVPIELDAVMTANNKLIKFRHEVARAYIRRHLFNPYTDELEIEKIEEIAAKDFYAGSQWRT
jgi:hypothetical protein